MFIDSHCHIHESEFYSDEREDVYARAISAEVAMICVGTTEKSSAEAVEFIKNHQGTWATIGVHPHDTMGGYAKIGEILRQKPHDVVGIGEIGLDYFYTNSSKEVQIKGLEQQLQWASDYKLPVSFHVREAFEDFWPILANFSGIQGVLHSFTDRTENLEKALAEGLFIGVNGISTFARDKQMMFDAVPIEKMVLETDAPFLTPVPFRGKVNEPAFVRNVAEYHASRRGIPLEHLARVTSANARDLFSL